MSQAANLLQKARSLAASGKLQEACETYASAARSDPRNITIWTELGATFNAANRPNEALQALAQAGGLNPGHVPALVEVAHAETKLGRHMNAAAALQRATSLEPTNGKLWRDLAVALYTGNAGTKSLRAIQRAHQLAPDDPDTTLYLGMMMCDFGSMERGLPHLRRAAELKPSVRSYASLANCLCSLSRIEEAHEFIEKAAGINPYFPGVPYTRTKIAEAMGRREDAIRIAEEALRNGSGAADLCSKYADLMRNSPDRAGAIELLREVVRRPRSMPPAMMSHYWLGLGTLLDAERQYKEAFECFKKGNELGAHPFDPRSVRARTDAIMQTFSRQALAALPKGDRDNRLPAFIVGMPRSGTTLLERIINAHPEAAGAGELGLIPTLFRTLPGRLGTQASPPNALRVLTQAAVDDMVREHRQHLSAMAPNASRIVDKLPHNFLHLGYISILFPSATIFHSSRHPLDTCLSCYMTALSHSHGYSFSFAGLVAEYTEYRRLMNHWKDVLGNTITDVQYENVVANIETEARRVISALSLPWNDACLAFHKSSGPVVTASVNQVRRPIYDSSSGRWKNYEPYIGELIEGLRQFL